MRSSEYGHLYSSKWQRARLAYLRSNPFCVMCTRDGYVGAAHVVDHKVPHKGDLDLFWDRSNWQGLCKQHHDSTKARAEARGVMEIGNAVDGSPLDPSHHWNRSP